MEADFESFLVPQIPELVEGKIYQKPPGRSLFKSMVSTTVDVPFISAFLGDEPLLYKSH